MLYYALISTNLWVIISLCIYFWLFGITNFLNHYWYLSCQCLFNLILFCAIFLLILLHCIAKSVFTVQFYNIFIRNKCKIWMFFHFSSQSMLIYFLESCFKYIIFITSLYILCRYFFLLLFVFIAFIYKLFLLVFFTNTD